jgi:hypothetical protein
MEFSCSLFLSQFTLSGTSLQILNTFAIISEVFGLLKIWQSFHFPVFQILEQHFLFQPPTQTTTIDTAASNENTNVHVSAINTIGSGFAVSLLFEHSKVHDFQSDTCG